MFQPAEREIKKVKMANNANTAIIARMEDEIATLKNQMSKLKNQMSELKGKLDTAMKMIEEKQTRKRDRQESEDDFTLFDNLPSEYYEELERHS